MASNSNNMCASIGLIDMVERDLPPLSVFISYVRYARTNMKCLADVHHMI